MRRYLEKNYFDKPLSFQSSIIGIIFIIVGIIVLYKPTPMNLKIGISSILIGLFLIIMITGKTTTKRITDAQITLVVITLILLIFFITGMQHLNLEIFIILIFIGLLIIKEISSEFIATYIKNRMNIFIFLFLIAFILIVVKKVIDIAGM